MNATTTAQPTLVLPEQLTMQSAAQALVALKREMTSQAGPAVVVDAQGLRVLDSSAVAVLLELRRELQAAGRSLSLRHPPQRLSDLVALYGMSELLPA
jgi:phospholipid transport system transporter-binding protein